MKTKYYHQVSKQISIWTLVLLSFSTYSSCNLSEKEEIPNNSDNLVLIGDESIKFLSAKLTMFSPLEISRPQSHIRAYLQFYTGEIFPLEWSANSSVISVEIFSDYTGTSLNKFPLKSGDYKVFSSFGYPDLEIFPSLDGKNFSLGPRLSLNHSPNNSFFQSTHDSQSGIINLTFDVTSNRVIAILNWTTTEGFKVTGRINLPLDLSEFEP